MGTKRASETSYNTVVENVPKYEEPFFYLWWYLLRPLFWLAVILLILASIQ